MKKKITYLKILSLIAVIIILTLVTAYFLPLMKNLVTLEGQLAFKNKIQNSGFAGVIILLSLQFIQMFLAIIPGEIIEILAGVCYGSFWGTIFIILSSTAISILLFFTVRKLGKKFVYSFCNEEKIKKIEKNKLFKNPKKIEWLMFILFFLPGTPKDLLIYVAGLLPIRPDRFVVISSIARIPSIISSTIVGNKILLGDWKTGLTFYLSIVAIAMIIILIINKFDKDKTTDEALKVIK